MIAVLLAALAVAPTESVPRRYAVVIGVNEPGRPGQSPLSYADDDAARFFAFFSVVSRDAALLSLLDDETQKLYPEAVAVAELPEEERVLARVDALFERIRADNRDGHETEFYFVYSGHGFVDDHGEGHLAMRGGTLSRTELYERIIQRSPAKVNHLIIDACDAYFVVNSRGDEDIEALLEKRALEFLARQTLENFPNTGAVLSTASKAESHEWSEIRAGVFSHGVRSALVGAADADQDGRVSYTELEAFVLAAISGVQHADANRAVYVRAPKIDRLRPVIDLRGADRMARLHLAAPVAGRVALADEQGRRYADLHKASGYPLALALLPGRRYFVRLDDLEYAVPSDLRDVQLAQLKGGPPRMAARGAIEDAFARGLFKVPYGPALVDGFRLGQDQRTDLVVAPPRAGSSALTIAKWGTAGAAVVAGGVAVGTFLAADSAHERFRSASSFDEETRADADVRRWDSATNVALGAAISFGVTAGILFVVDAVTE